MSANPGQAAVTDAMREHAVTTFIQKPFDVDQLVHEIHVAVARAYADSDAAASQYSRG